ncbi:MAG: hypothetical protein HYR83_05095 [Planctomycetes bacterium]|nr:hypothetical protein [Planctomycetota bacterium]
MQCFLLYCMTYWYHGRFTPLLSYLQLLMPYYLITSVVKLMPCFVAAGIILQLSQSIHRSGLGRTKFLRLGVYPASFLPLLPLAIPVRIFSTLFVHASRPHPEWRTVFWWVLPNGTWSQRVYGRMFPVDWFEGRFEWSNPLRITTLLAVVALILPLIIPRGSVGRLVQTIGLVVIAVLWPVSTLYGGWLYSLSLGATAYFREGRRWTMGLASGCIGLLCLFAIDTLCGGWTLYEMMRVLG